MRTLEITASSLSGSDEVPNLARVRGMLAALLGTRTDEAISIVKSLAGISNELVPQASAFRSVLEPALWLRIGVVCQSESETNAFAFIDLCRTLLALDPDVRQRTRAYGRLWRQSNSDQLNRALLRIDDVGEACTFLSSYKPRGPVVTPPFCLTAELLLRAKKRHVVRDGDRLSWFLSHE